ncbi:MAG: hypothetical protein HQK83_20435 [Fibrobacteria bacterium]|nr:hypothetical protein [Fibrobacteria bacterium]
MKKKPLYKGIYVSLLLIICAHIFVFLGEAFRVVVYVCNTLGLIIGCVITYYYWKWLPKDLSKG